MTTKTTQLLSIILFIGLGYIALQIPLTYLLGANTKLTVFDAFAPIAGGLFSLPIALMMLMGTQGILLIGGNITILSLIKIFTPLVAAFYFTKQNKLQLIIPIGAIIAFTLHPVGRSVWYYSLFWTIPVICYFIKEKSTVAKALGATFSAHAVGGAAWVYLVPLPKAVWISLIPTVAIERLTLAAGMIIFYFAFKAIRVEIRKPQITKTEIVLTNGGHI